MGTPYGVFDTPNFGVVNTTHYPTMVCALAAELLEHPTVERFTSWAFYMEGKRWFEGNRALVTNENVELPVLDGFRMLERLGDDRVDAHADGVGVLAGDRAAVVYHHEDAWWVEGARNRDPHLRGRRARRPVLAARQQPCPVARDGRAGRSRRPTRSPSSARRAG